MQDLLNLVVSNSSNINLIDAIEAGYEGDYDKMFRLLDREKSNYFTLFALESNNKKLFELAYNLLPLENRLDWLALSHLYESEKNNLQSPKISENNNNDIGTLVDSPKAEKLIHEKGRGFSDKNQR